MSELQPIQPPLFDLDEERALFLSHAETCKRYTAGQAEKLEWKRNLILLAIGSGVPVATVSREANVSTRTIEQLVCSHAEKVAAHQKSFAAVLLGKSARWLALAQMREGEAKFAELVVATGITAQRANELSAVAGMGSSEGENVIQMADDGAVVLAELRKMLQSGTPKDSESPSFASIPVQSEAIQQPGHTEDTRPDTEQHECADLEADADRAGGGVPNRAPLEIPMCPAERRNSAKDFSDSSSDEPFPLPQQPASDSDAPAP